MSTYIWSTEITNAYIWIPFPESITLDKSSISLTTVGQTEQLTATIEPTVSDKTITWSSDDTTVATVSTTGLVTCVTPWTCTITATTVNGLTASCSVRLLVTVYKYLRWSMTKNRANSTSTAIQMAEFGLYDWNWNKLTRPSWASVDCNQSYVYNEWPSNLIDWSLYTKFNTWGSYSDPLWLTITLWADVDFSVYNTYKWYTANDAPERDPVSWTIELSNDWNNWITVDTVANAEITTSRRVLAFTWTITL